MLPASNVRGERVTLRAYKVRHGAARRRAANVSHGAPIRCGTAACATARGERVTLHAYKVRHGGCATARGGTLDTGRFPIERKGILEMPGRGSLRDTFQQSFPAAMRLKPRPTEGREGL